MAYGRQNISDGHDLWDTQDATLRFPRELCALVTGNQEESL
jgi:hypothetical protein